MFNETPLPSTALFRGGSKPPFNGRLGGALEGISVF